jgi:hypothetical protein
MIAGCYTLDLYCDYEDRAHPSFYFPHQFFGETYGECARQARRSGWTIGPKRSKAICPLCSGKRRVTTPPGEGDKQ